MATPFKTQTAYSDITVGLQERIRRLERENAYLREQAGLPEAVVEWSAAKAAFPTIGQLSVQCGEILKLLYRNKDRVIRRESVQLMLYSDRPEADWPEPKTFEVQLCRIRKFLRVPENNPEGWLIGNSWGQGWVLTREPARGGFVVPKDVDRGELKRLREEIQRLNTELLQLRGKATPAIPPEVLDPLPLDPGTRLVFIQLYLARGGRLIQGKDLAKLCAFSRASVSNIMRRLRGQLQGTRWALDGSRAGVSGGYWLREIPEAPSVPPKQSTKTGK